MKALIVGVGFVVFMVLVGVLTGIAEAEQDSWRGFAAGAGLFFVAGLVAVVIVKGWI